MVFSLSAFWCRRIRGLWKLPGGRDWLRGKLGLVLMGGAMLSKSLIQFSVDGWGCVKKARNRALGWYFKESYHGGNGIIWSGAPYSPTINRASLVAQTAKCLCAMQEARVRSLCWDDPLEKEMAAYSNILAWKTPWTAEPGRLPSMGSQRVGHTINIIG